MPLRGSAAGTARSTWRAIDVSELSVGRLEMPAADLGPENPLPPLHPLVKGPHFRTDPSVPEEVARKLGGDMPKDLEKLLRLPELFGGEADATQYMTLVSTTARRGPRVDSLELVWVSSEEAAEAAELVRELLSDDWERRTAAASRVPARSPRSGAASRPRPGNHGGGRGARACRSDR